MCQNAGMDHEGELCEKAVDVMCISKKFFQEQHIQDIQGEVVYADLVVGVQEGVGIPSVGEIVKFLRSELSFLEA